MDLFIHFPVFLATALLLNVSPGPDSLYIVGRTLAQGRAAGLVSVLGISTGSLCHTLAAALGLSAFLMTSALAFTAVKTCGAIYLFYLGARLLLTRPAPNAGPPPPPTAAPLSRIYAQGLLTNLLNPKVSLFFLALLPQFIAPHAAHPFTAFLLLGLTFVLTGTLWCVLLVYASSLFAATANCSRRLKPVLDRVIGALFIGLGLRLALQER